MGIFRRIKRLIQRQFAPSAPPPDQPVSGREPALPEEPTNLTGMEVLLGGDKAVRHLIEMLGDDDPRRRERAALRLKQAGYEDPYLEIEAHLSHSDGSKFDSPADMKMIRAAGRLGDRRAFELLLGIAQRRNTYSETRKAAILSLGVLGDPRAIEPLRRMAAPVRNSYTGVAGPAKPTVEALKRLGDEGLYSYLVSMMDHSDSFTGEMAVRALGYLGDRRAVPELLARLQSLDLQENDTTNYIAARMVEALGELGDPRAVESLIGLLAARGFLHSRVVYALGVLGDKRAVQPLIDMVNAVPRLFPYSVIDHEVVEALGRLGDQRGVDIVAEKLAEDAFARSSADAALALGNIGGERAVTILLGKLNHRDAPLRKDVVMALGLNYATDTRVPPAILGALEDKAKEVRRNAAKVLGENREQAAVGALIEHLKSDKSVVRAAASHALKKIGTPEALQAVKDAGRVRAKNPPLGGV